MRAAIIVASMLAAAAPADAGEPARPDLIPPKAKLLVAKGRSFHDRGDYARAILLFKEAYVIAPSPGLLFNLGQAYRLQGNCDDAITMYRRYLATNPSPDGRTLAQQHLTTVERCVAKRGLKIPMGDAMAYLDVAPPPDPTLALISDPPPPASTATDGRLKKRLGLAVGIGGAAALGGAAWFGYRAYAASRAVEDAYAHGAKWKDVRPIAERGASSERYAMYFGIGGGVALATGATLYVLGRRAERPPAIAIVPTRTSAEVTMAWPF